MKILNTEIYRFSIPMVPFVISSGTMNYAQNVLIRVFTDEEFYGVGECSAFPMITGETQDTCLALAKEFARIWKYKNPLEIDSRLKELNDFIAGNTTIKSAFDMALFDIAAKVENQPLYKFLRGERRTIETDITIGIGSVEEMAQQARIFKARGASTLKIKLGKNPDDDLERIHKIRNEVGDELKVRIDANQGWSFDEAISFLTQAKGYNIQFCEQPLHKYDDDLLPMLKAKSTIKIMADESCFNHHDARKLIQNNACDFINIKLSKSGGIQEALKIYELATEQGICCMIGGMLESRIALSAKVHFAYACSEIAFFDLDTCLLGHLEDPARGGAVYKGYFLDVPDLPGIGADADPAFLRKCESWKV